MSGVSPLPPERSPDRRGVETVVLGLLGAIPWVGSMITTGVQQGIAAGQERLLRQWLTELATSQDRFLLRLTDVELDTFLARSEAAAALNQATQIALKTPSREKHHLLGRAVLNAATSDSEDSLVPFFWTLVDKHSALEVRLLAVLSDPVNRAIDNGAGGYIRRSIAADGGPRLGHCLFAALPELRHEFSSSYPEDDEHEPFEVAYRAVDHEEPDDEGDEEGEDAPVTGPPDRGWLFHHLVERLDDDGLLEEDSDGDTLAHHLAAGSDILDATLMGLDELDESGHFADKPHCDTSHLGDRYLAFLLDEPTWPATEPGRPTVYRD